MTSGSVTAARIQYSPPTLYTSLMKKKLKDKAISATHQAIAVFKGAKTSPSKIPALFCMKGWNNVKVLTEDEKQDFFAAESEGQRLRMEAVAKRERIAKATKDVKRKEGHNEQQHRHRASKRAAAGAENSARKQWKVRKKSRPKALLTNVQVDLQYRETASHGEVAEASHPAHEVKTKIKAETRKPSGCKQKYVQCPAKYVSSIDFPISP
jgi:hypothetical protein